MKVAQINAINLNRRKVENFKSQDSTKSNQAGYVSLPSNTYLHPIQFGVDTLYPQHLLRTALANRHGIISPYDGRPMLPATLYNEILKAASNMSAKEYTHYTMKILSEPENFACMKKVNATVFKRIEEHRLSYPDDNLFESLLAMREDSKARIIVRENRIIKNIETLSGNLSASVKDAIKTLTKETKEYIKGDEDDTFRRKIFIKKLKVIGSSNRSENPDLWAQILDEAHFLPTSTTNADAFIVKYSRNLKPETNMNTNDIIGRINDLDNELEILLPKKTYRDFAKSFTDLRLALATNSGYKKARKTLLHKITDATKMLDSFENIQTLNEKCYKIPISPFSNPEDDMLLRQVAIVTRLAGDSAMSDEHLLPQDTIAKLIEEDPIKNNYLSKFKNSPLNIMLVDRLSNSMRSNLPFTEHLKQNPKIKSEYMQKYFDSIFHLIKINQLNPAYTRELEEQIQYIEDLSAGELKISNPFRKTEAA